MDSTDRWAGVNLPGGAQTYPLTALINSAQTFWRAAVFYSWQKVFFFLFFLCVVAKAALNKRFEIKTQMNLPTGQKREFYGQTQPVSRVFH